MGCGISSVESTENHPTDKKEDVLEIINLIPKIRRSNYQGQLITNFQIEKDFSHFAENLKDLNLPQMYLKDKEYTKVREITTDKFSFFVKTLDYEFDSGVIENLSSKKKLILELRSTLNNIESLFDLKIDIKYNTCTIYFILVMSYQINDMTPIIKESITKLNNLLEIELSNINYSQDYFNKIFFTIKKNNSFKKLKIKSIYSEKNLVEIINSLKKHTSMEKLELDNINLSDDNIVNFEEFFCQNKSLKILNISGNKIDSQMRGCEKLKLFLTKNSEIPLKKLNISKNILSENGLISIAEICKNKKFTKLNLAYTNIQNFLLFKNMYDIGFQSSNIQVLDLSGNYIDLDLMTKMLKDKEIKLRKLFLESIIIKNDTNLKEFAASFIQCYSLEKLSFNFDYLSVKQEVYSKSSGLSSFFEGLNIATAIENKNYFKMANTEISFENSKIFYEILSKIDCFNELDLSFCKFNENSLSLYSKAFLNSKNLDKLILTHCNLNLNEIICLSDLLTNNKSISLLDMSFSNLDSESLSILGEGCSKNKGSLKILKLNSCITNFTIINDFLVKLSNSHLEELQFLENELVGDFEQSFFVFFGKCKSLSKIKIGSNSESSQITHAHLIMIGAAENNNLSSFTLENIKVDSELFNKFIKNNPSLNELILKNFEKDSLFMKYISNSVSLKRLNIEVNNLDQQDAIYLQKLLLQLNYAKIEIRTLNHIVAETIIEGLNNNNLIQYFEIFHKESYEKSFEKAIYNYYNYAPTCNNLENIQIVYFPESIEADFQEKKQKAVKVFDEFFKMKEIQD